MGTTRTGAVFYHPEPSAAPHVSSNATSLRLPAVEWSAVHLWGAPVMFWALAELGV